MTQTYYKFLKADGLSPFQNYQWPLPKNGKPGKWLPELKGELKECQYGYHVCLPGQFLEWLDDVLWEVETKGQVITWGDKYGARQARLIRKVGTWNPKNMRLLMADYAEHVLPIFEKEFPKDNRPRQAIEITRQYANGKATIKQLTAARAAAGAAAGDAAGAAAGDAGDAARAAAGDARAAARGAARAAAGAAARAAARAAAGAAARAARAAERKWQNERLLKHLNLDSALHQNRGGLTHDTDKTYARE